MWIAVNRLLFSSLCFIYSSAIAQQQMGPYIAYGPETKYFSSLNYGVYQSKNGYLWFGTSSGVVRFDGKRYKNYFADYTNSNSTSDNIIFDITEDKNNDIWLAGFRHGLTRYNQRTGKFKKYPALSKDSNPYYGIYRIRNDSEGHLWIGTAGRGLARYDFQKDTFQFFYPHPDQPKDGTARGYNFITDIEEDKTHKNILWISTFFGLFSFDKSKEEFTYFFSGLTGTDQREILINDMEFDRSGRLWIGTYGDGLAWFDPRTKVFSYGAQPKFSNVVYDLKLVNDSTLYAACLYNGLYQINIRNGVAVNITPQHSSDNPTTKNPDIQRISVTPKAGIFIGGNYYFYQRHDDYLRLQKNIVFPSANTSENISLNGITWDKTRKLYWITTFQGNGVYALSEDLNDIRSLSYPALARPHYFTSPVIDAKDRVWVLNHNQLYQWDDALRSFIKPVSLPLPDSVINNAWKMTATAAGNIWMMCGNNFIYWEVRTNRIESYPLTWSASYKGLKNIFFSQLRTDAEDEAWLFSESGIFHCNRKQKKVDHVFETGTGRDDRKSYIVLSAAFDRYNAIWLTSGNGIQIIDKKKYSLLSNHDVAGGLPSMQVRSVNIDSMGRVWAGTTAGLALFNPKNKTWRLFNRLNGLEKDYLDGEIFLTANNNIAIEQPNGFLFKNVDELVPTTESPLLRITSIRINGYEHNDSLLPEFIDQLVLPYNKNNIDIEFAAMDWLYPSRTFYYYRIDGVFTSDGMSSQAQDGRVSLIGLQPGTYTLRVLALSGNGVYSKELVFPIIIKAPFWKTWWFISLCILVFLSIVYGLYRYRVNRLIEMQSLRNSISKDLHDDIGASLSNINILNELTRRNIKQPEKSKEYLAKASEDIQRISEALSDIVWNINPKYDDPENLFIRMKRYVADMLDGKNIRGEFDFPDHTAKFVLSMTKRRDLYLIFKEAVNNLVKYSEAKNALIRVKVTDQHISVLIKDDGKGFDRSTARIGNGLQNMEQRAKASGGVLVVHSTPGSGTTVELSMKIG